MTAGHGILNKLRESHPRRRYWLMRRRARAFQALRLPHAPAERGSRVQALAALRQQPSAHTQPPACKCMHNCYRMC